jgi:hypothetical protein
LFRKPLDVILNKYWRNSTNENKGKAKKKVMQLLEQSLEFVSVFKEASRNFICIILLKKIKANKKILNHLAMYSKKWFNL